MERKRGKVLRLLLFREVVVAEQMVPYNPALANNPITQSVRLHTSHLHHNVIRYFSCHDWRGLSFSSFCLPLVFFFPFFQVWETRNSSLSPEYIHTYIRMRQALRDRFILFINKRGMPHFLAQIFLSFPLSRSYILVFSSALFFFWNFITSSYRSPPLNFCKRYLYRLIDDRSKYKFWNRF